MSHILWKSLLENDVDTFQRYLASATFTHGASKTTGVTASSPALKIGSPGSLGTSPKTPRQKKGNSAAATAITTSSPRTAGPNLSRAEINRRDALGRTLLHHAASLRHGNAMAFVGALLDVPLLDLYVQDMENGWTALHRALYFGNIDVAHALVRKDVQNVTDFVSSASLANLGGLVKIKDLEGNSPLEVYSSTIAPRLLDSVTQEALIDAPDDESVHSFDPRHDHAERGRSIHSISPKINLQGDEVFAFGSNKNLTLGLGDEDDRQYPERIILDRPESLLHRLHEDYLAGKLDHSPSEEPSATSLPSGIPAVVRGSALSIQDVAMSKMHTAVLTNDPASNLYICGFGPGGRLGTGDETTRFSYVCIQGGGIAKRKVIAIALGQYHTIAICSTGEVFTWGSNKFGQLGYTLPETAANTTPMQLVPRQLYGLVKKEQIIGAAASSVHSVIYSTNAMYTFGKNQGQLGLVDADARSLDVQVVPRRVGTSILQSPLKSVSAIDRATSVLLENHDVIVFTQYAWKRVVFPLEESPNGLFTQFFSSRYSRQVNSICKITGGGNTICALSTYGQVFTLEVPPETEQIAPSVSTTNPNKAKNALPQPTRVWSIGKPHMSAIDTAVGQDGSIILCTAYGSVWRKEKRAKIKSIHQKPSDNGKVKDYKFVRVANLTRSIAVRSNAYGAFIAIRKDTDVTKEQLHEHPPTLWNDMFPLLAFRDYGRSTQDTDQLRFWVPRRSPSGAASIRSAMLTNEHAEDDFIQLQQKFQPLSESLYDVWVMSNVTEVQIPAHSFLLKARSGVLRSALAGLEQSYYFSIPDVLAIGYGPDGCVQLTFQGADFLTLVNIVLYVYSDNTIDWWHQTSKALHLAPRYRQVRVELMKIAAALGLRDLERATRIMVDPVPSMRQDFELAYQDLDFWAQADVVIELADGAETPAHSVLLCVRCPFFEGLFNGRTGGMWMSSRRHGSGHLQQEPTRVDLKHIEEAVFLMVLRHMYSDTDEGLFDDIVSRDLDEFIDLIIEVMSVANELMLDRLAQICQKVLGRYVTPRNVCGLLNTVAECSVHDFKQAALEYICLNLETMLELRLLDELEDYLLDELNVVVQDNQMAYMPFVRSDKSDADLIEQYPQLIDDIERDQQRRVDYMRLPTRYTYDDDKKATPKRRALHHDDDLPFAMDEDGGAVSPTLRGVRVSPSLRPEHAIRRASHLALSTSFDTDDKFTPTSVDTDLSSVPASGRQFLASPPLSAGIDISGPPRTAWKTMATSGTKTDLRSIIEQTTGSRVSALTQQMTAATISSPVSSSKMSQKERKRQQQEARKQESAVKEKIDASPSKPQSPWTKVAPAPQRSISSPLAGLKPEGTTPTRPTTKTRQTASAASIPSSTAGKLGAPTTTQPASPQIQSVRHMPMPDRTGSSIDARTSMSDILAQQQGEKMAIKEAVAKRSLQEIQQEQEFQAWWDQESRRVQEEEAQVHAVATRQSKSSRGGRKGGRVSSSRGGAKASSADQVARSRAEAEPTRSDHTSGAAGSAVTTEGNTHPHRRPREQRRGPGMRRERGKPDAPSNIDS